MGFGTRPAVRQCWYIEPQHDRTHAVWTVDGGMGGGQRAVPSPLDTCACCSDWKLQTMADEVDAQTTFIEHGYNVWIDSIPDGTSSYNLPINLPSGLQFILTMWGEGGISKAGTTDILTVGAPAAPSDQSCFLSDQAILNLYTFSFNITSSTDFPPQCSNLTANWPSSLESNVTADLRREVIDVSLDKTGNTTKPPTLFGIIPLGNSFNIPITYSPSSRFAQSLPASSISDTPTTYTRQGRTYLNWTIPLAKGTRFMLVAGVGSDQEWASGGSSAMITVGQGNNECVGNPQGNAGTDVPSVTATGTSSASATSRQPGSNSGNANPGHAGLIRTVVACVLSILGTLLVVLGFVLCWRLRKRRREAAASGQPFMSGGIRGLLRSKNPQPQPITDSPLDLILTTTRSRVRSRSDLANIVTTDPFSDGPIHLDSPVDRQPATALSPLRSEGMTRQSSRDELLSYGRRSNSNSRSQSRLSSPILGTTSPTWASTHGPLMLHEDEDTNISDLKRDTLASTEPSSSRPPTVSTMGRRRREEQQQSYVVHRDAGRVEPRTRGQAEQRVVELPPRYEELDWENEEEGRQRE
ncbi:hypothetical protein P7C73_g1489, partial [Tremellales sp. Uapishka_1]